MRQVQSGCDVRIHWRLELRQPAYPDAGTKHAWDSTGEVRLTKDVDQSLRGKNVILVEDILDTGLDADVS